VPHHHLSAEQLGAEIAAFDAAVDQVVHHMRSVIERLQHSEAFMAEGGDVLSAHLALAEDAELRSRVVHTVETAHINVGWALERVLEDIELEFGALNDPYIAARVLDLRQVFHRLQQEISGATAQSSRALVVGANEVLVARDHEPVMAIEILQQQPAAVVIEEGTTTSHLALLCRALRVPAMVGVRGAVEFLVAGDQVLLDLEEGIVVRDPDRRDIALARAHTDDFGVSLADPELPGVTSDGVRVHLYANIDVVASASDASKEGAEGIGLFRSEYLFIKAEEQNALLQAEVYQELIRATSGPVVVRTFDVGSDKLPLSSSWEPNPALGLRALRSYKQDPEAFRQQLRALLGVEDPDQQLRILLPMVDGLENWLWAVGEVDRIANAAGKLRGKDFMLGAMVEVPSLLFVMDEIAAQADFLSLGTNDLVQYLLAVDRQNPGLVGDARVTHPALIRALDRVVTSAHAAEIPVTCCGEMASTPLGIMILVGLGLRHLSVPPSDLAFVRTFLRRSDASVFEGLVRKALSMTDGPSIHQMLSDHYTDWKTGQRQ
jgi:phosphoenolpyruvate-protein kinase (PTS system EI component)